MSAPRCIRHFVARPWAAGMLVMLMLLASANVKAQQKNFINRTIDWGYRIVQGDSAHPKKKYYFVIPILAYKPETRAVVGVSLVHLFRTRQGDSVTRPSTLRLNLTYSQNDQASVRPFFDIFTRNNKFNFRGIYTYTSFAEYYWGIGINAPKADKELYHFRMHRLNLKAAYQFVPGLYAGPQYNMENMFAMRYDLGALSRLNAQPVPGNHGSLASGLGFTVYFDNRNNIYYPTRGQFIELSNCFYRSEFGSEYTFSNVTLDARKFVKLWNENVLAFELMTALNSGNVPFRMMGTLGSDSWMRGYYSGRYRDQNAMAFQAELRKKVWGPLGIVVFGGGGTVSPRADGLVRNLRMNYGAGLRIMAIPREKMNIRMDYGAGEDGNSAFYVTMSEAF